MELLRSACMQAGRRAHKRSARERRALHAGMSRPFGLYTSKSGSRGGSRSHLTLETRNLVRHAGSKSVGTAAREPVGSIQGRDLLSGATGVATWKKVEYSLTHKL